MTSDDTELEAIFLRASGRCGMSSATLASRALSPASILSTPVPIIRRDPASLIMLQVHPVESAAQPKEIRGKGHW